MQSYHTITRRVIELLEQGVVPWHKPWSGGQAGHPKNLTSGKGYRGVNVFLLHCMGYESPWWITYKQAKDRGGHVRKGEKGSPVVFWKWLDKAERDPDTGEVRDKRVPMLRQYTVFNVDQCEGIDAPALPDVPIHDFNPIEQAETIVQAMPKRPDIRHTEPRAYYSAARDFVNLPQPERFAQPAEYYSTLFHELTHATGHDSRLGRLTDQKQAAFGSGSYSREELVAEMGAAFLCGESGIVQDTIDNSAAYISNWLKRLCSSIGMAIPLARLCGPPSPTGRSGVCVQSCGAVSRSERYTVICSRRPIRC